MENVVILGARRTAIGTFGGIFSGVSAIDLGVHTLKAVLEDTGIAPDKLDEVITGNIFIREPWNEYLPSNRRIRGSACARTGLYGQ